MEYLNIQPLDFTKARILFAAYFLFPPVAGFIMAKFRWMQKATFLVMCLLIMSGLFHAQDWGLTIHPVLYRGHARGFHFYWPEVFALALIWATMLGDWKRFRFFPPGFWLYIIYCSVSLISIINAPVPLYSLFSAFKAFKIVVIFVATYNFIKNEDDIRYVLICLGIFMLWQLVAVLNQKYVLGIYQVWGTFEHQNSLCMFTIMIGMLFLAVAMGPRRKSSAFFLFLFVACAAIVQSTLSRAGLFIFAAGAVFVVFASLLDKVTRRRLGVLSTLGCIGVVGLAMTVDTIVARFQDYGNDESRRTREHLNISARMMLNEYPLGIGWNNFGVTINFPYHYSEHIDDWHRQNGNTVDRDYQKGIVESLWWLLLSETGYQGFISYLVIVVVFMWWNLRNAFYFRKKYLGAVSIGIFVGFTMNYLQSFLERVLTQPRNMMLWFILMAITARIMMWRKADKQRRKREARERIGQVPHERRIEMNEPVAV